ncbi:MAG: acyltransferase [Pseudomonas gingeri]
MNTRRLNELDLLRFLAAVAVVIFHYAFRGYAGGNMSAMPYPLLAQSAKYGYLGVELFFMISGFVILMTASNNNLKHFFISRAVRLYPALWACCTITFLLILTIGKPRYSASFYQYIANMTLLSDFMGVPSIDGVYWSLFIEIKFYLLISVLLGFRQIAKIETYLMLWLLISTAAETLNIESLRSILITNYSAYFIAGATFYLAWTQGITKRRLALLAGAWGLATYTAIIFSDLLKSIYSTPFNPIIVCIIISLFFLTLFMIATNKTSIIGRTNWTALGALTYPLYLLHQVIGFMIFNIAYPTVNPHVLIWTTTLLMIVASYSIHKKIEAPIAKKLKQFLSGSLTRIKS